MGEVALACVVCGVVNLWIVLLVESAAHAYQKGL